MKASNSTSRKIRSQGGRSSTRHASKVRHRAVSLKLESLEQRTLLSGGASVKAALSAVANAAGIIPVSSKASLPPNLLSSVEDAGTVATVVAPSSPVGVSSAATSHIYTGQPTLFTASATGNSSSNSSSTPGPYNPIQAAALGSLAQSLKAVPQYLVMPTTGSKEATPDNFLGPAGYSPAQIIGAYGIVGDGAGQTIAVTDAGDYSGLVNSTDPNFNSSALHVFDQQFGLPDPPSFMKYNQNGQTSPLPSPQSGWGLEITLDVEWAHAIAPAANIDLVEANASDLSDLGQASNTGATLLGASVVSQSWGLPEIVLGTEYEQMLEATYYAPAIASNPNVTFLAATGDDSASVGPIFPSVSPLNVECGPERL